MAAEKYGRRQTGGGPPPPKPSETTEWLNSIMGESISGLPAMYDSDALISKYIYILIAKSINLIFSFHCSLFFIDDAVNMEIETIDLGTT